MSLPTGILFVLEIESSETCPLSGNHAQEKAFATTCPPNTEPPPRAWAGVQLLHDAVRRDGPLLGVEGAAERQHADVAAALRVQRRREGRQLLLRLGAGRSRRRGIQPRPIRVRSTQSDHLNQDDEGA